ncbi:MAG: hypothetical protein R3B72_23580 [Polyangiaceae bacterium]
MPGVHGFIVRIFPALRALAFGAAPALALAAALGVAAAQAPAVVPVGYQPSTADGAARRALELRAELPPSFTVVAAPPYVVVGDAEPEVVRAAAGVARATVRRMQALGFTATTPHSLDLWVFPDRRRYRDGARALLGEVPPTDRGYYLPRRHAVLVNLEAGFGAVAHEAAHPLIQASFPSCPVWLDEGLASLEEHRLTPLEGTVTARLQRLQGRGRLRSIAALTVASPAQFYDDPLRTTYGQAAHLLGFLEEEGLLRGYLGAIQREVLRDPTGYRTLADVVEAGGLGATELAFASYLASR